MKKIYQQSHQTLDKLAASKHLNNLKRKEKKYQFPSEKPLKTIGNNKIILAPPSLSAFEFKTSSFSKTLKFKEEIDKFVGKKHCLIDFTNTVHFSVGAMLLIFSSVQLALKNAKKNTTSTSIIWSQTPSINKIIKRMQLHKICKQHGQTTINFNSSKRLQIVFGTGNDYVDEP